MIYRYRLYSQARVQDYRSPDTKQETLSHSVSPAVESLYLVLVEASLLLNSCDVFRLELQ